MASTAAAPRSTILVAAVFLMLLHSSTGRQPGPAHRGPDNDSMEQQPAAARAHHCRDDTEQQPPVQAPAPTPMPPAPALAPTPELPPTPAPAPAIDCPLNCSMQCSSLCEAKRTAGLAQCQADLVTSGNACYDQCVTNTCPDQCVNSGCGFRDCSCDNTYVRSCCNACGQGLQPTYFRCVKNYDMTWWLFQRKM
ncbi:unnamed protein product [Urochloa humidicola]